MKRIQKIFFVMATLFSLHAFAQTYDSTSVHTNNKNINLEKKLKESINNPLVVN